MMLNHEMALADLVEHLTYRQLYDLRWVATDADPNSRLSKTLEALMDIRLMDVDIEELIEETKDL